MAYIGARVKRSEDVRLLRGIGKYVGDIHRVGMVQAAILRSPHAHARIVKLDTTRALKLPGVIGVLTAAGISALKSIPIAYKSQDQFRETYAKAQREQFEFTFRPQ